MRRLLPALLLLLPAALAAQENHLSIDADFLTRGEVRYGGLSTDANTGAVEDFAAFILERTLLGISYDRSGLSAKVTAQHCGTWGSAEGGYFNVYEAWVRLSSKGGFFGKVGRQNLSYDDQRIFGMDDWAMTARSHDAVKLGYEGHGHKVHLIGAFNQNLANMSGGTFYTGGLQPYKTMQALWYHYDVPGAKLGASLLAMNVGMQGGVENVSETVHFQQLLGAYVSFTPAKWSVEAAYYHQLGKEENGLPLDAWMASLKAAWRPGPVVSLYGGYDYLSGDPYFATPAKGMLGLTRHETVRGFHSLYGSHHKFYGAMDFFYVTTYVSGFTPGLQNLFLGGKYAPAPWVTLDASFHYLATATRLQNAEPPLGFEMELSAGFRIGKLVRLSLGYSFMHGTETMIVLKKSSDRRRLHWGWMMLSVTPKFLNTSW